MQRRAWVVLCCALGAVSSGCGSSTIAPEIDGASFDGGAIDPTDDAGPGPEDEDAAVIEEGDAGAVPMDPVDAGMPDPPVDPGPDPRFQVEMTFVTANIGREYTTRAQVATVIQRIANVIGGRSGPRYIGWQEIGEGDPCGDCEIEVLRARFPEADGWDTRRPAGARPAGGTERVKVPVTSRGATVSGVRAEFASPGWAGVSPTRFVTVVHHADRNLSIVNTHLIAGAWSCGSEVARRRDYWRQGWAALRAQVALEHDRGRNVIVTGDLNRPRAANDCNPAWEPASLHPRARVIGGVRIDYVFAVPAEGWRFTLSRRADDTVERGTIELGIDGHDAHWVAGRFEAR